MDLTTKKIFMFGGHLKDHPQAVTYSIVVSRDLVKILLIIASFNDFMFHILTPRYEAGQQV